LTFASDETLVEYDLILKEFVDFTAFLISHSEILGVVHKLLLVNAWGGKKLRLPCPSYAMVSANLIKILSKLTCLAVLEVSSNAMVPLDWRYFDSNVKIAMTDALQRTFCKQISLANVQGLCEIDISHLLMFCKNVELNACIMLSCPTPAVSLCTPLITSTFSLKLSNSLDMQKVACFPARLLMGLSSLILQPGIGQMKPFLDISRAARHTLLNLEWLLGYSMNGKSISFFLTCRILRKWAPSLALASVIDLGIFPNLRSFAIRCSKYGERLEGLSILLRTVAVDNEIETITIIMAPITELGLYSFLNDFQWEVLDDLLRGETFKNLRRFVLRLQWIKGLANFKLGDLSSQEVLERLRRRLPGLGRENISISHDDGL
jgi:hypothetical protein